METHFLYAIPIPLLFGATLLVGLAAIEGGRRLGVYRRISGGESPGSVGSAVGATLGLLAFILAFTFGIAASRYDARKQLVVDEANAIGTCFLRTDFLPEAQRAEARSLLSEYVALRADAESFTGERLEPTLARAARIQTELWELAAATGNAKPSPMTALFAASLNEVIDIHEERVTKGITNRIPGPLWGLLYLVATLAMVSVGYLFGLDSDRRSIGAILLAVTFSTVLVTIADLDDGAKGALRISQSPIQNLHANIAAE